MAKSSSAKKTATSLDVCCPFCSLLCDDLTIRCTDGASLEVEKNGCKLAKAGFERTDPLTTPQILGEPASLDAAIDHAAKILNAAKQPLFAGLGTDVAGAQATLRLAEATGGILDHLHGDAMNANIAALQDRGTIGCTLSEIRNRADLVIFAGVDPNTRFPRFMERILWNQHGLGHDSSDHDSSDHDSSDHDSSDHDSSDHDASDQAPQREIVTLGEIRGIKAFTSPSGVKPTRIPCANAEIGEVAAILGCLIKGSKELDQKGASLKRLQVLAARMRAARYGVIVYSPAALGAAHADLGVGALADLVRTLNTTTRFALLSLGGNEGAITMQQVCAWQTGYPLRIGYVNGTIQYDPQRYATQRVIDTGDSDALVWIESFGASLAPPANNLPTVALTTSDCVFDTTPEVVIPIGTPGRDHAGQLFRTDNIVTLPLQKLRASKLPAVSTILDLIAAQIV